MRTPAVFRLVASLVLAVVVIAPGRLWAADPATKPSDATGQGALTPCLAVAADNTPVWPATSLPSSKRLTVMFRLGPQETAQSLESKWVALGTSEQVVAENKMDLKGQKTGWLRLSLKQPAPPGKYRLDATLDGKPWQSVDIEITPALDVKDVKPADLVPLAEGTTLTYEMVNRPGPGTTIDMPGVKPEADGSVRATLAMTVGKSDDNGTHYTGKINDQPAGGEMWVKLEDKGLMLVRRKTGENVEDVKPPENLQPLPPKLEDGTEWTCKTHDGEQKLQLFGPLMVKGPDGAAPGYVIFSDEEITVGNPGASAARGRETKERHYVPKVGLVRETRVTVLGGKLQSRHDITLVPGGAYTIEPDPTMKGRLGKVEIVLPEGATSSARIGLLKAGGDGGEPKEINSGHGAASFEVMPGKYEVAISGTRIPVEVKSAHRTIPKAGVLRVHAGAGTRFKVLDGDGQTELTSGHGEADVRLPAGTYVLDIGGSTEQVKVTDGKVTEF